MKYQLIKLIPLILLFSCTNNNLSRLEEYGPIKIGDSIRSFTAYSINGVEISHNYPKGNFYIHLVHDSLPPIVVNEEFGKFYKAVLDSNGVLIGGSDGKYAASFGISNSSKRQWNNKYKYSLDESLAVCTDKDGEIIAIYKDVDQRDIKYIVKDLGLEK